MKLTPAQKHTSASFLAGARLLLCSVSLLCWVLLSACGGCKGGGDQDNDAGCTPGTLSCSCEDGVRCGLDARGVQMACMAGLCDLPDCTPGSPGCACDEMGACGEGLECSSSSGIERCEVTGCAVGEQGCGCSLDRACAEGNVCVQGVCEATDCTPGSDACACTASYGCDAGLQCDVPSESCVPAGSCTTGSKGCDCLDDGSCRGALICTSGVCQAPDCPAGLEGCACLDGACGVDGDGEQMMCVGGVCQEMTCPAGSSGCACRLGKLCDGAGDTCIDGFCRPGECIPGSLGCGCLAGGCNPGLTCQNDTLCINNTGLKNGPCKSDGTCERNNRCDRSIAPNKCVFCDLGTKGCQCLDDGSCGPGLSCEQGHCVGDETVFAREVPESVTCYTPCSANLTGADGTTRYCEEGLLEGCLDGQTCDKGSCVDAEEGMADVCFEDSDCPSYQLCIKGYCYAECAYNSDCGEGLFCHDKVCRKTCSLLADDCPRGTQCDTVDGQNGFCVTSPSDRPAQSPPPPASGSASVSKKLIEFTNTSVTTTITLHNDTDQSVDFTLRKVEHDVLFSDGARDKIRDDEQDSTCSGAGCPMWWLEMGEFGAITTDREITVRAAPRCGDDCPRVVVRIGQNGSAIDATRWRGVINVESSVVSQRIDLTYVASPEGRWAGKMYYFANFDDTGIDSIPGLTGWIDRPDKDNVSNVRNGLIQRWAAFRNTGLSGGGWNEMKAVLTATQSEQWKLASVREECEQPQGACYLYDTAIPKAYVTRLSDNPIPTGALEYPIAINLYRPDPIGAPEVMKGRIVSDSALHYSGYPAVDLVLTGDPTNTMTCDADVQTNCVNFIDSFDATIGVGGRYTLREGGCAPSFDSMKTPWLVPGFLGDATQDPNTGAFARQDCIDTRLPYYQTSDTELMLFNKNIARANPIPVGRVLDRQIEFLDGAMIDQSEMIVFFRERSPSALGGTETAVAYGYMLMKREPVQIEEEDLNANNVPDAYEGSSPPTDLPDANVSSSAVCSRELLDDTIGLGQQLDASNAKAVVNALIKGGQNPSAQALSRFGPEHVHYLCEDTGLFDGGPENTATWQTGQLASNNDSCASSLNGVCEDVAGACAYGTDVSDCGIRYTDQRVACPRSSRVIYFTLLNSAKPSLAGEPCQQHGTCRATLNQWVQNDAFFLVQLDPIWTCANDLAFCDSNELDRREDKVFYSRPAVGKVFTPLLAETAEAFRYKTKFRSRSGSNVGFSPILCGPISDDTPYCYDAEAIESIAERTSCLLDIYKRYYTNGTNGADAASVATANLLIGHLKESFSETITPSPSGGLPRQDDGFEKLNAELLIMLGDDAFTSAFESRFDLAGGLAASFEGEHFEPNGINLSGVAGYEMFKLYQAVQYYELALDRFYMLGDVMRQSLSASDTNKIITSSTVVTYFTRIVRASTQRARALSEISRRYQNFNRPDLAKLVAQRAYTSTYLESMVLSSLIDKIYSITGGTDRPQILQVLEESQLRYKVALLDVVNVYGTISQDINYFGYAPDYIPFPALDQNTSLGSENNAFARVLRTALSKLDIARIREQTALSQTRSYETDAASFQSELARISQTYENQLIELCGVFTGTDGLTYPAISRYAYLNDRLAVLEDPCGFVDNGAVFNALANLQLRQLETERVINSIENVYKKVEIERQRVSEQCDSITELADFQYEQNKQINTLQEKALATQQIIEGVTRGIETVANIVDATQCDTPISCAQVPAAIAVIGSSAAAGEIAIQISQKLARDKREERYELELENARWVTERQCDVLQIDSNATTSLLLLEISDLEISLLASEYQMLLALGQVTKLRQQAARVQLEWEENLGLAINVEAARNNPNIRIYRNDSVINAEISFEDALREAYRLTRVYEFYTSTTYAQRDKLFLMRMVSSGDINLENYVYELANAFTAFEENYGNPEQRLQIISLRDDIIKVPRLGEDREPLSTDERTRRLREYLANPSLLNEKGYLAIPFRTNLESLSPLTRNHKVLYIEAGIEGDDNGDFLGRLYVRQQGTSVVKSVEDETQYYRFPERTAVINPFFNNAYQFKENQDLYRSFRLRDRPMINTDWELVINQRDELVNQDINIGLLTDIKLYIYYSDFTVY